MKRCCNCLFSQTAGVPRLVLAWQVNSIGSGFSTIPPPDSQQKQVKAAAPPPKDDFCTRKHDVKPELREAALTFSFWVDRLSWKRAAKNTLRCLLGCSLGDFGMMFSHVLGPATPQVLLMGASMVCGILTSLLLETLVMYKQGFKLTASVRIALNMSFMSMLSMELAENAVVLFLTEGMVLDVTNPLFLAALVPSLLAGFLTPLPYNYYQLKKHGKACH